jgi:hypothetical protein
MVDLAYTPEEMTENKEKYCCAPDGTGPKYPWGLSLSLETETLNKLGMTIKDFEIGSMVPISVMARVTSLSMNEREDGDKSSCVGLICAQMDFNKKSSDDEKADKLYNK